MASDGFSNKNKAVKIVIITTEYVETDAMSFKSVVQKLTGKCSYDERGFDESTEAPKAKREKHNLWENGNGRSSFFISDSLFNEYDMLLSEKMLSNDHFLFESQI
ncbi:VQ motif-containing protein 10-like [Trifolium pratense]|uniref:VQ motif-containing protein 10-like n=1 Tax=Trifolium pratense TaxID=57577 RepID=UPI001E697C0C|nr:VQ motif-containing protein 10-like [Trifolium pratense]